MTLVFRCRWFLLRLYALCLLLGNGDDRPGDSALDGVNIARLLRRVEDRLAHWLRFPRDNFIVSDRHARTLP
jgi:hypothetical protein